MSQNLDLLEQLKGLLKHKKSKQYYAEKLEITEEEVEGLLKELKLQTNYYHQVADSTYIPVFTTTSSTGFFGEKEVNNEKGTLKSLTESDFDPKSDLELAQLHKIDLTKYKISSYWSKLKSNGKFTSSVFCTLKKPQDYTVEDFSKFLSTWEPTKFYKTVINYPTTDKGIVDVELNISDFHLAKKTKQEDNLSSKELDYFFTINDLIEKVKSNYNINKIVFPISNDFFHTDTYQNTTTNGTPQDVTAWYDEEYEKGFDILSNAINYLITQANEVEVILVQGNHDRTKGFFVAHALEVFFKKFENVKFQRHHSVIKATTLGNTFIGYHHGNSCKLEDLPLLFATGEFAKDFGNAKYREVHTGDKHHYMAKEVKGVRIQQMPSLSGTDRWHQDNGYVNQLRAALALVYDHEKGKIAEFEFRV